MRRMILVAYVIISIAIIGLFLSDDSRADVGAVGDASFPFSPSTVRATEILSPTHWIYLPFACKSFPPVIQVPEGEYLFVEYWTHSVLDVNCVGQCVDFPAYHFDPQSGELTIYTTHPPDPALVLDDDDIGYIGSGVSLGGVGGGANSSLIKIQGCPLSKDGITLRYVDEAGAVTLEREGEVIVLQAGEAWVSDEEIDTWDWLGSGCVVTSTHYISNYAFQDRNKIIHLPYESQFFMEVKR